MNPEQKEHLDRVLRKLLKACVLFFGVCGILLGLVYLANQPWLPYTEPEIQQIIEDQLNDARFVGFYQETENCRVAIASTDAGKWYVMVQRQANQWEYVEKTNEGSGFPPTINCSN